MRRAVSTCHSSWFVRLAFDFYFAFGYLFLTNSSNIEEPEKRYKTPNHGTASIGGWDVSLSLV